MPPLPNSNKASLGTTHMVLGRLYQEGSNRSGSNGWQIRVWPFDINNEAEPGGLWVKREKISGEQARGRGPRNKEGVVMAALQCPIIFPTGEESFGHKGRKRPEREKFEGL